MMNTIVAPRPERNYGDTYGAGALTVPEFQQQQPGRRQLATYRPMAEQLKYYIDALAGPAERAPLIYTGDAEASLDRLHQDLVSQYRELSIALGEHERRDLTTDPPPLLSGIGYGRLSLAPGAAPAAFAGHVLRLPAPPSAHYGASRGGSFLSPYGVPGRSSMAPCLYPQQQQHAGEYHAAGAPPQSSSPYLSGFNGSGCSGAGPGIGNGGLASFGGGLRGSVASAPSGQSWELAGGIRPSNFALGGAGYHGPEALMAHEESRLLYPPIGSTFEGHASRAVEAVRGRGGGIDTLSDLQYRQPKPLQYGDMLQESVGAASVPRSEKRSERDQLDSFLSDFAAGRAVGLPPSYGAPSRQLRSQYG